MGRVFIVLAASADWCYRGLTKFGNLSRQAPIQVVGGGRDRRGKVEEIRENQVSQSPTLYGRPHFPLMDIADNVAE
jgi:hypothetical protein